MTADAFNSRATQYYDHAPCGLMITDSSGNILRVNATFCELLAYQAEDLIGKCRVQDLFSIGSKLFHQTHWGPLLHMQGFVSEIQLELLTSSRQKIPVLLNATRKHSEDQIIQELAFFVSHDRSKYERELLKAKQAAESSLEELRATELRLRSTEAELLALNKQLSIEDRRKNEFLATLAHELRNPLAPMRNVLEAMKLRKPDDAQIEWSRQILDRQVGHLTHLVNDLMEVSRITQSRIELKKTVFNVSDAIRNSVEAVLPAVVAAKHKLEVRLPDYPLNVEADTTRIVQMIYNLLNNAIKYTPAGGVISVHGDQQDGNVLISVKDNGIGLEQHQLTAIFQMFSQIETALDRSQGGLGIGLALVKGLAELHGGTITARSEGLNQGSEFLLCLPLSLKQEIKPQIADTANTANFSAGRKVLVIDDNADITDSLLLALELLGYEARAANDGLKGLALAATFLPEIILLDIGLPNLNGYEIAALIRDESWGKNITLIAVTGWGHAEDKANAIKAGFDLHLTKPIDFEVLDSYLLKVAAR
jgi:signal transduction histidine kinase/ActR/RegA family two-component response regulator